MRVCVQWHKSAQGNACIIHDGIERLAGTQCLVKGQTVGSVCPMAAGMAQPKLKPSLYKNRNHGRANTK